MSSGRTCSECGTPLQSRSITAKTCSDACRLKRSRRHRRAERKAAEIEGLPFEERAIAQLIRNESSDVITRVMHDELQPIVREALTEDVLRAVNRMVGLTERAVELIATDLESDDDTVRQRAYTLITKYTIGHPALLQPKNEIDAGQLVVNFNLPRPDVILAIDDVPALEIKVCDMCNIEKPIDEFVAGSERCLSCFDEWKAAVFKEFGE